MGILSRLFGVKGNIGELLIPCQNSSCRKIFKESEGKKFRSSLNSSGLYNFQCPFCNEKFALSKTKLEEKQKKLRKSFKANK